MKKRFFSALLTIVMLISSFAPVTSLVQAADKFPYYPYLDEDGYYYRIYNSEPKPFNTDWDSVVDFVATEIQARKKSITIEYATKDESYAYICNSKVDYAHVPGAEIYAEIMADVAELIGTENYTIGAHTTYGYANDSDYPYQTNPRYYPFTIILSSIEYTDTEYDYYPYYNENNGNYYRISNNAPLAFNTDYDEMISYIQSRLKARRNTITYYFATTDEQFKYTKNDEVNDSTEACENFVRKVFTDVYKKDSDLPSNASGGDYLFKSIKNIGSHGYTTYTSNLDDPVNGGKRYYVYRFTMSNISYFTTIEQEEKIAVYCSDFSERFIKPGASDYEKVKTIYDYVVRNTKYDYDVFTDRERYPVSSERYTVSHSAYGAIVGNLSNPDNYSWSRKETVTGLTVISNADQGLAVCEGYSKLFYYLCVMNGIPCRIVDGDYVEESGKGADPHEWNYVWLDDGSGDGYKWFEVDTTFAAQKSLKDVDINDYNYFLCGRENINFGYMNHQQPFHIDNTPIEEAYVIYDYWGDNGEADYVSSLKDYQFRKINFSNVDALENGYVVRRSTVYEGEDIVRVALIYSTKDDQYIINRDDDGHTLPTDIHGFIYNGKAQSVYEVVIPYLDIKEYDVPKRSDIIDAGTYEMTLKGANNTSATVSFKVIPMDMDNSHEDNYDDESVVIQNSAVFTGNVVVPQTNIVDGYKNKLTEGVDYRIDAYSDANHTKKTVIQDIGTYYVDINYDAGNNYSGHYYLTFVVEKVGMDQLEIGEFEFPYLPESIREQNGYTTPALYYKAGALNMKIGDHSVRVDTDYSVSSIGGLSWGESGRLIFTGLSSSETIATGSKKEIKYTVSEKYDITKVGLDGAYADSNKTNQYTYNNGRAIKPVKFDNLDKFLIQGEDYIIDGYSNNTDAGEASVKIKGINGCTGTVTMHFRINPASLSKCVIDATGGKLNSITYNGTELVKDKDYKEEVKTITGGYRILVTGINNFSGTYTINVKGTLIKPTSSGNYAKLATTKYTYDGKAKKPAVTVYNKNKKAVNPNYYTVTYSANKNVGTGKATVKFKNGYSGTMTYTFVINPKGTTISSVSAASKAFTLKWKKQATQTTGYEIQYATDSKFTKNKKTVVVSSNSTTSKKVTGLKAKKTYYVRLRTYKTVSGKKYYSGWTSAKTVKTK